MHRTSPHHKKLRAQEISSAKAGKPWPEDKEDSSIRPDSALRFIAPVTPSSYLLGVSLFFIYICGHIWIEHWGAHAAGVLHSCPSCKMGTQVSFWVLYIHDFLFFFITGFFDSSSLSKMYLFDSNQFLVSVPVLMVLCKTKFSFLLFFFIIPPNSLNRDYLELPWKGFTLSWTSGKTEL